MKKVKVISEKDFLSSASGDSGPRVYNVFVPMSVVDGGRRCEYCGSLVPDEKFECPNCGAPRLEGE